MQILHFPYRDMDGMKRSGVQSNIAKSRLCRRRAVGRIGRPTKYRRVCWSDAGKRLINSCLDYGTGFEATPETDLFMNRQDSRTIVFLTGAFLHHSCWDEWKIFFERQGYSVLVPPWPHKDAPPDVLRSRHPDAEVAAIRLAPLTAYFTDIVMRQSERPVLIGHSLGGLIAQQLLARGLAAKAVAMHSVPPQGVFVFSGSFLRAGWPALGFFTSPRKTFMMSFPQWQYGFANGMPQEWQEKEYCLAIPESKWVVRDTIGSAAKVDFRQTRGPLLLVAGSADRTIPAKLNYANYRRYGTGGAVTEYKEFPGRNHGVLLQPGWEEVATFIGDWVKMH